MRKNKKGLVTQRDRAIVESGAATEITNYCERIRDGKKHREHLTEKFGDRGVCDLLRQIDRSVEKGLNNEKE